MSLLRWKGLRHRLERPNWRTGGTSGEDLRRVVSYTISPEGLYTGLTLRGQSAKTNAKHGTRKTRNMAAQPELTGM